MGHGRAQSHLRQRDRTLKEPWARHVAHALRRLDRTRMSAGFPFYLSIRIERNADRPCKT